MVEREILESNLHLTYRKDLDILFLRWFRDPDSVQLRQGYLHALDLAKEVRTAYYMFDLRSRGQVSAEDEAWLLQTFFPLLEEELNYPSYYANLVTPTHYAYIRDNVGLELLDKYSDLTKMAVFTAEQDAVAWLLKSRADR
ncbi:hypothetical protein [Rufibacter latericius]|uniref:STAS/SEC14 domain-containing protein n=1 Tax=Rufibacter latericius TaxID=2487040 RepID=A0A3M9MPL5_9BACT|nr:hypothetical protein [Rufibacter latericius]RNI26803.1 hypothetical protein EFB08_09955 [Rufibacter latericius]